MRGTLIDRECISLTREMDSKVGNSESSQRGPPAPQYPQSKTPNILNMQKKGTIEVTKDENSHRVGNWKGLKPQLAAQKPAQQ